MMMMMMMMMMMILADWWTCPSIGSSLGIQTEFGHYHLARVLVNGCWLSFLDSLPPTFLQKHRQNHHRSIEPNVETTLPWCNPLKTRSPPQLQPLLRFHICKEPRSNSVPTSSSAASNVTTSCNRWPLWPADNWMDAGVDNLLTTPMMAHSMALEWYWFGSRVVEAPSPLYDIKLRNKLWAALCKSKLETGLNLEVQLIPAWHLAIPVIRFHPIYAACHPFQCQGTRSNTRSTGCRIQCQSTLGTRNKGVACKETSRVFVDWLDPDLIQSDISKFTTVIDWQTESNGHSVYVLSRLQKWAGINMTMV